ncbi:MAG: YitT family protein [Gammaproteobacteria bacterium]|nr:YitT family protein [Gammaproteobacteria bacterium]
MKIFSVKSIPTVSWSSDHALNFRPRLITLSILCVGLTVFGIGESLLIAAGVGNSPWTVLSQGISQISGWSIGVTTFLTSLAVLIFWVPLRQRPGIGTILNAVIISVAIELSLPYLPQPDSYLLQVAETGFGIFLVGFGSGLYLIANLGPGPRDGLMTGLQRVSNLPVARVRTAIEITVVILGALLGGTIGLGTVLFAFGIGPAVSMGLYLVNYFSTRST